jgi:TorA maturation chaperone TorD
MIVDALHNDAPESSVVLPEDRARADMYALIGRLFYAAPDSNLFAQICKGGEPADEAGDASALARAWQALRNACKSAYPDVVKQEHDTLFIGVGKAEVTPYTSHYVAHSSPDRHLVMLREQLDQWGLARSAGAFEVEDHIAGLCDVMRFLIEQQAPLADQRLFFERFVYPGALPLFEKVKTGASAGFYKSVVAFAGAFLEVEKAAYDMDEAASATQTH